MYAPEEVPLGHRWLVDRFLAGACIYGQVIKKRKKNRVTTVRRTLLCGTREQLEDALLNSEDSSTLNTSFVERHNLTIRQGSSILCRRTACHAREDRTLVEHLELLQLHYNFMRPTEVPLGCGLIPLCGLALRCGLQRCKPVWRSENCASVMCL